MNGKETTSGCTVTVGGRGRIFADPDLTVLSFRVTGLRDSYAASAEELNRRVGALRDDLEAAGVGRERLKTRGMDVRAEYSY